VIDVERPACGRPLDGATASEDDDDDDSGISAVRDEREMKKNPPGCKRASEQINANVPYELMVVVVTVYDLVERRIIRPTSMQLVGSTKGP
jgi:hypothetical protein